MNKPLLGSWHEDKDGNPSSLWSDENEPLPIPEGGTSHHRGLEFREVVYAPVTQASLDGQQVYPGGTCPRKARSPKAQDVLAYIQAYVRSVFRIEPYGCRPPSRETHPWSLAEPQHPTLWAGYCRHRDCPRCGQPECIHGFEGLFPDTNYHPACRVFQESPC